VSDLRFLYLIDRTSGAKQNYGAIANERREGRYELMLTFDPGREMWWVIAETSAAEHKLVTLGFEQHHRTRAFQTFDDVTERQLDAVEPTPPS